VGRCCCNSLSIEEEEALVTSGGACKFSCSFLKQQLLLLMEELVSKSLFHIPNPSAVGYSSTQPHKQPHLEDSGLLQLSSLASKPALFVSLCPSVPLCVCSSVGFSVSLSLFRNFLCNFATALKIFFVYGSLPLYWFLCFGFLTQFFATC
jgi:hypothetical protein